MTENKNTQRKPRRLVLNLDNEEVDRLSRYAIRGGLTVGTLLEDFAADLTESAHSCGSDERDLAGKWYDRHGYEYEAGGFSQYLARYDAAEDFFRTLDSYDGLAWDLDHADEDDEEDYKEYLKSEIAATREDLESYLNDYLNDTNDGSGAEYTLEAIIADAKAHRKALTDPEREDLTEREPTEGAEASPEVVGKLEALENNVYREYKVNSKPAGRTWLYMALDLARKITEEPGLLEAITDADLDQLTEDNYHTARHAAEVVQRLQKYTL